jgi:hypothetical protein
MPVLNIKTLPFSDDVFFEFMFLKKVFARKVYVCMDTQSNLLISVYLDSIQTTWSPAMGCFFIQKKSQKFNDWIDHVFANR